MLWKQKAGCGGSIPSGKRARGAGHLCLISDCVFGRVYLHPSLSAFQISVWTICSSLALSRSGNLSAGLCLSGGPSLWVSVSVLSYLPALGSPMSLSLSRFHVSSFQSLFGSLSLSLTWIPCLCLSLEPVSGSLSLFCLWVPAFSGSYLCVHVVCVSVGLCLSGLIYLQF